MYQPGRDKLQSLYYNSTSKNCHIICLCIPLIVQSREFQFTHIEHAHGVVYVALGLSVYVKPK